MEDKELRQLLRRADTKAGIDSLDQTVVANAAMKGRKAPLGYRGVRALVGSIGAAALVVSTSVANRSLAYILLT